MRKRINGFTLIEVAFFIALTGLLFMGVAVGTANSIAGQRFYDATQNFAEFLRSVYSQVANPQSIGSGRGDLAIYGKMISFGQNVDLDGSMIPANKQKIFVYDVVGDAETEGSGTAVMMLGAVGARTVVPEYDSNGQLVSINPAGFVDSYEPKWGATLQTTAKEPRELFTGTILIVRHPRSGTINTLVSPVNINMNQAIQQANQQLSEGNTSMDTEVMWHVMNWLVAILTNSTENDFVTKDVDFCLNPDGFSNPNASPRRDIRIVKNARNASGVEVIDLDDNDESDDGVKNNCV